ncbi:glycosyl transferase group 1 [Thermoanaerobacter ethanolicus JW 200]|uniref:glycosyltransferase n=1 Tax=Thermoanaerobacter ethanolicus TaxID=1757 RepID=UPI000202EE7C|nr:glycosyl transferase group 1 [Thermoanaerobacter ethanolicus JW 200]
MKVRFISPKPFSIAYGGLEIQLKKFKEYLEYNKIEVDFLDFYNQNLLNDIDILHFNGFSNWYAELIPLLKNKYPNLKLVILPTYFVPNLLKYYFAKKLSKLCFIPNYFSYKRKILLHADAIITNSISEKKQLLKLFNADSKKIHVVYNAVDENFCNIKKEDEDVFIKKYNIDRGYLLCVGYLDERKNSLNLIRAYLNIYNKIKRKLVLIGDIRTSNIHYKREIMTLIEKNTDKILWIKFIEHDSTILKSAYYNCELHVLPSKIETPGLSNLEAGIFGKKIVVGDCAPVREYFGDYAYYCKSSSIKSIETAIINAINDYNYNPNELQRFILSNYTWKKSVDKLISIYNYLITG